MGLLDRKPSSGGLLGQPAQNPGLADYALALLAGGVGGAAGLALDNRMQQRRHAQAAPVLQELESAFAPQRQGAMGPGLDGAPMGGSGKPAAPSLGALAPLLLKARRAGIDTAPYEVLVRGITGEREAARPTLYNTRQGIVAIDPDGNNPRTVYDIPEEPDAPPSGYRHKADGTGLEFIPGGPADPAFVGQLTGVRRDAVVSRPMPTRPRAAGGGRAPPKPPAGFILNP